MHTYNRMAAYTAPTDSLNLNKQSPFHTSRPLPRPYRPPTRFCSSRRSTQPQDYKPCKHHLRCCIPHPFHQDEQCRAPDHPKYHQGVSTTSPITTCHCRQQARFIHHPPVPTSDDTDMYAELPANTDEPQHEQDNLSPHESEFIDGMCILDSGAHPAHTSRPTTSTLPIHHPLTTIAATN